MPDVLFNPESKQIDTLKDANKQPVFAPENPQMHVRKCCEIVRGLVQRRGIDESAVPCIHRIRGRFRYWDLRRGRAGASHKCVLLCSAEWRLADTAEVAAQHRSWEQARASAAATATNDAAAKSTAAQAVTNVITQASKLEEPEPVGAAVKSKK